MRYLTGFLLAVVLAGCGRASTPTTVQPLVGKLQAADICTGQVYFSSAGASGPVARKHAECPADGVSVGVGPGRAVVMSDAAVNHQIVVAGTGWAVSAPDGSTAEKIHQRLGGSVKNP